MAKKAPPQILQPQQVYQPLYTQMGQQWADQMYQLHSHSRDAGTFYFDSAKDTLRQMGIFGAELETASVEVCETALLHWRHMQYGKS